MYKTRVQIGGIRWNPSTHEDYKSAAESVERLWSMYQNRVETNRKHPPVTVSIEHKGKTFMARKAKRDVRRLTNWQEGQCADVSVKGIPALALITYYDPGSPGDTGGPVKSYLSINPPEPPELEFELYDSKGYRAEWLDRIADKHNLWEDIEKQIWSNNA